MFFLGRFSSWWHNRGRAIYHYRDDTGPRRADPLRVIKALEKELPDYLGLIGDAARDVSKVPLGPLRVDVEQKKRTASEKLASASYTAFDLKPLGPTGGVTDGEALRILVHFLVFMEDLAAEAEHFTN